MTRQILGAGLVFALLAGATGCGLARPLLLWREPAIFGKAKLLDVDGEAFKDEKSHAVTVNFINLEGRIEESVISVRTDDKGRYRSPELPPGEYAVEALARGRAAEMAARAAVPLAAPAMPHPADHEGRRHRAGAVGEAVGLGGVDPAGDGAEAEGGQKADTEKTFAVHGLVPPIG